MIIRLLSISLLLLWFSGEAQTEEIAVTLDSIHTIDSSVKDRKFILYYHIQNKTASPISFILNPNAIRSNVSSSLAWTTSYRLFQNDIRIDAESISSPLTTEKNTNEFIENLQKELRENKGNLEAYLQIKQKALLETSSKNIRNSLLTFVPNESRSYVVSFDWDKNRYVTHYENEYYLDEKTPHYIDLVIVLMKDELYPRLLPDDKLIIDADKTILRGWINSNKLEINFKE